MNGIHFPGKLFWACLGGAFLLSVSPAMAHTWVAPADAAARENPVPADSASALRGEELFLANCASCHGENAKGAAAGEVGLKQDPPDLVQRLTHHSDGDFFWKIEQGRGEMPAFADILQHEQIWDIINFIKTQ